MKTTTCRTYNANKIGNEQGTAQSCEPDDWIVPRLAYSYIAVIAMEERKKHSAAAKTLKMYI